jgi:maleate cis-trans isomerase
MPAQIAPFERPVYGWRGTIGVIDLATSWTVVPEYYRLAPDGVAVVCARLPLPRGETSEAALVEMTESEELEAAAERLACAAPDLIVFACTTGSLVKGPGWDKVLRDRIEARTGVPATTTSTAVLAALAALGARRLAIATPYVEDLNRREVEFFEAQGYPVAQVRGLGVVEDRAIALVPPAATYRLARDVDRPEVDCLFISCTNLATLPIIARLEADTGKPVVTSNQATIWYSLRRLGVGERIPGFGRLLETA